MNLIVQADRGVVEWYGFMGTKDEVIVPVLAPAEVLAGIAWQGMEPVFADLDMELMSLTPASVLEQVTVHTRGVFVTPIFGVVGNWEDLRSVTEPRGILLQVEGAGGAAKWEKLAAGLRGMAASLIQVDAQLIHGGAEAFAKELASFGIECKRMPEWRGRKRDFPGMASIESQVLVVENWPSKVEQLQECARVCSRQGQFAFEESRRLPGAARLDETVIRRAV